MADVLLQRKKEKAKQIFDQIDTNKSGKISKAELVAAFTKRGKTAKETEADFDKYDVDHSGELGFEEFFNLLHGK